MTNSNHYYKSCVLEMQILRELALPPAHEQYNCLRFKFWQRSVSDVARGI